MNTLQMACESIVYIHWHEMQAYCTQTHGFAYVLSEYRNMLKTCNASLSPSLSIPLSLGFHETVWNVMKPCESALPQLWYKGRGRCTNSSNEAHQYQMHQQKVARRQNIVIYSSWGLSQKLLWLTNGFYMFLLSNPINMPSHNILRLCGASLAFPRRRAHGSSRTASTSSGLRGRGWPTYAYCKICIGKHTVHRLHI